MHILVTGATGFVGSHIIKALLDEGHSVIACARNREETEKLFPDCRFIQCDFMKDVHIEDWLARLKGIDIVINTVGIIRESRDQTFENLHTKAPVALFQACEASGVKCIIQISALGADRTATTDYHKTKKQADDILRNLDISSVILRPSLLYGEGGKSWRFFQALSLLPIVPVIGDGKSAVQPVHTDDLVKAVLTSLSFAQQSKFTIDFVGNQTLTFYEYLKKIRSWLGQERMWTFHISYNLAMPLTKLNIFLDDVPFDRNTLVMLKNSKVYSPEKCEEILGFIPEGFDKKLKQLPSTRTQRLFSRLYFLEYLLCWSLAIMWIWTAIVSAFLYPIDKSYDLLAAAGVTGLHAPIALYGASLLDLLIGLALIFRIQIRLVSWLQIYLILIYTTILTFSMSELWLHPFGPLTKNIPVLAAIIVVLSFQEDKNV